MGRKTFPPDSYQSESLNFKRQSDVHRPWRNPCWSFGRQRSDMQRFPQPRRLSNFSEQPQ